MKSANHSELVKSLLSESSIDEVKSALKELSKDQKYQNLFISRLKETKNPLIRAEIAICLSDLAVVQAIPIIMSFIKNKKYKNVIGSPIYAMQNFDCSDYLMEFVKIVCSGNYEARELSLQIIEDQIENFSKGDKLKAVRYIKSYKRRIKITDDEDLNYLNYSINLLGVDDTSYL